MIVTPLGDLVRPINARAGVELNLPVYSVTKHGGFVPSLEYFKKQVFSRDTKGYKLVEPGDFAYATIHLDEGSIGIAPERGLISPMYTVFRIDTQRVDPNYLIRFLKSPRSLSHYHLYGKGAVHRRKSISLNDLGALPVPLPSLSEQRRVAAILDKTDTLCTKRRQALTHVDALHTSIFHDMFGDPDAATENVQFREVASLSGGRNLVGEDSTAESEYRVLKISAVTTGRFNPNESKPLPPDYVPPTKHLVRRGDLLMSRANTEELVGAVALVTETPPNLALPDKVWRFDWKTEAEPVFWHALMGTTSMRRRISRLASGTGGSMKNIAKARLEAMPLPKIALDEQTAFAYRSAGVEANRLLLTRALAADDALFRALQSRVFEYQV